jgi:hypothetical protein
MSDTHEVISTFLDDEPFDPGELEAALSDSTGRAMLIDLLVLRRIVQPVDAARPTRTAKPAPRFALRPGLAAAAIVVALAGGYFAGTLRAPATTPAAPPPTRVVQATTGWQEMPGEVRR